MELLAKEESTLYTPHSSHALCKRRCNCKTINCTLEIKIQYTALYRLIEATNSILGKKLVYKKPEAQRLAQNYILRISLRSLTVTQISLRSLTVTQNFRGKRQYNLYYVTIIQNVPSTTSFVNYTCCVLA